MAQEMMTIEIEAALYERLTQLAAQRGQTVGETVGEVLKLVVGEAAFPSYPPGQHPVLALAGIIDTDQTDLSQSVRDVMNDPAGYDEFGFRKSLFFGQHMCHI